MVPTTQNKTALGLDPASRVGAVRWSRIDALRGAAVLLVLLRHHPASGVFHHIGWVGVDLFFVLSGFLISGLVFDELRANGQVDGLRFLLRRGFKIYPSFYAFILLGMPLLWVLGEPLPLRNILAELVFLQNYHDGLWIHTWTLGVEEHFYLLLIGSAMLAVAMRMHIRWRSFLVICVILLLTILALRVAMTYARPFAVRTHMIPTHFRLDTMLAGVLLSAWYRYRPCSFLRVFGGPALPLVALIAAFMLPVLFSEFGSFTMITVGLSGTYVAASIAVGMAVAHSDRSPSRKTAAFLIDPFAWVGRISYTTYLWHMAVLVVVQLFFAPTTLASSVAELLLFMLASVLVGWLAAALIERPLLRFRDKRFPSVSRARS